MVRHGRNGKTFRACLQNQEPSYRPRPTIKHHPATGQLCAYFFGVILEQLIDRLKKTAIPAVFQDFRVLLRCKNVQTYSVPKKSAKNIQKLLRYYSLHHDFSVADLILRHPHVRWTWRKARSILWSILNPTSTFFLQHRALPIVGLLSIRKLKTAGFFCFGETPCRTFQTHTHWAGWAFPFFAGKGKAWEFLSRAIPSLFFGNLTSKFNFER